LDDLHHGGAAQGAAPVEVIFEGQELGSLGEPGLGLAALDADGDGRPDLLAWSASRVVLFRNTVKGFAATTLPGAGGPIAIGDFNNDGLPDLCVLTKEGPVLWTDRKGTFVKAEKPLHAGVFPKALWVDYDHDYDLDLLLLGSTQALLRNNG